MSKIYYLFSLFLILTTLSQAQAQTDGTERILVLPQLGYTDEQGLGLGAQAAWFNITGSGWTTVNDILFSGAYSQALINSEFKNNNFFEILTFQGNIYYNKSNRSLFYGLGNNTSIDDAAQYALNDSQYTVRLGVKIFSEFVMGLGYIKRSTGLDRGADPTTQQLFDRFNTLPRLSGANITAYEVFASFDTRDSEYNPRKGTYVFVALDQVQPKSGEDLSQQRLIIEGKYFLEMSDKDHLIVFRGLYDREWGEDVPFFLRSRIGGAKTFRPYRTNRFTDSASFLINSEYRWLFWAPGGIIENFELSGGLDLGKVYDNSTWPTVTGFNSGFVVGLTGLLSGGIPVRFDVGLGPEGKLFYLHLFYPF